MQRSGGVRQGVGVPVFIAPLDAGASVGAEEVKSYSRISDVTDDFGNGSDHEEAAKAALPQLEEALFVAADDFTDDNGDTGPFTETITGTSTSGTIGDIDDDGTSERVPITTVTDVKVDGSVISGDILYMHKDPSTFSVSSDDVLINPVDGSYELGTAPSTDAEFSYEVHDWDAVFDLLDSAEEYEATIYANKVFKSETIGVYDKFTTHAENQRKVVVAALSSGVDPATLDAPASSPGDPEEGLVEDNGSQALQLHSLHFSSGDATSAYAATIMSFQTNGSATEQPAPQTITHESAKTYRQTEIGDPESPSTGTFLNVGVVPTYRDRGLQVMAADRAAQPISENFFRNFSTTRVLYEAITRIERQLVLLRREDPTAIPFNGDGQAAVRGAIKEVIDDMVADDKLAPTSITELVVPAPSTLSDSDKVSRVWSGIEVPINIVGQAEVFLLDLNAVLA